MRTRARRKEEREEAGVSPERLSFAKKGKKLKLVLLLRCPPLFPLRSSSLPPSLCVRDRSITDPTRQRERHAHQILRTEDNVTEEHQAGGGRRGVLELPRDARRQRRIRGCAPEDGRVE